MTPMQLMMLVAIVAAVFTSNFGLLAGIAVAIGLPLIIFGSRVVLVARRGGK